MTDMYVLGNLTRPLDFLRPKFGAFKQVLSGTTATSMNSLGNFLLLGGIGCDRATKKPHYIHLIYLGVDQWLDLATTPFVDNVRFLSISGENICAAMTT